jgi:hypothetical protein
MSAWTVLATGALHCSFKYVSPCYTYKGSTYSTVGLLLYKENVLVLWLCAMVYESAMLTVQRFAIASFTVMNVNSEKQEVCAN